MKIALVQENPVIGDIDRNLAALVQQLGEANRRGADLAICTELALCGYPPRDLLERPAFLFGFFAILLDGGQVQPRRRHHGKLFGRLLS